MKKIFTIVLSFISVSLWAQTVSLDPTITPALFMPDTEITVVYDVTGTSLASLTNAYAWVWIPGKSLDAKYNVNPASNNPTATDNAKFVKSVAAGKTLFTLVFKPVDFFTPDISGETTMGILLKGNDWSNGQTTDYLADFWDGSFQIKLLSPASQPLFVMNGQNIDIEAEMAVAADVDLYINDVLTDEQDGVVNYTYAHTVTETSGYTTVRLVATTDTNSDEVTFLYILSKSSPEEVRPEGIIPGINYDAGDNTKATLCLWAPGKTSVYVLGDFTDWDVLPQNLMKRDGEFFWIERTSLTPGEEYGFQYLIDEEVYVADPYSDKILDPDDQYIPGSVYPGLKPYPAEALHEEWYFNRVSVLQTSQSPYVWQSVEYQKPEKEKLVIYELLIRDFFDSNNRSYQNLIDTIGYFKRLGVNVIELMPIMEFNGNDSWGYNPTFMLAPDKYYGPKNKLKEFVDKCHQEGIAVILDIALNHQDIPNPYVLMDFDFSSFKPQPDNKWFNVEATHPFNVFYDMNHESTYTKKYLDTVSYYWLNEYKVDGFRYDLSKGFTQVNNPNNVNAWSAYDASRIAILKRMADKIWEHTPEAYIILEHLSVNTEEKELAEYRVAEGKGMMLWGNMNYAYNQNTMGYSDGSDISGVYFGSRNWSVPHLVSYMESHDEERLMYKNLQFGNASGSYSAKNLNTALDRVEAASLIFYTIPGPKMLWQFGELGYDISIDENGRVGAKPVKWDYYDDYKRHKLYEHTADLLRLRNTYSVFTNGTATLTAGNTLLKQLTLKNDPYTNAPANANEMNAVILVNFDITSKTIQAEFPHAGTWFDYYENGKQLSLSNTGSGVTLLPGQYKLYTDIDIGGSVITSIESTGESCVRLYPNPVEDDLYIHSTSSNVSEVVIYTTQGVRSVISSDEDKYDVRSLSPGLYIVEVKTMNGIFRTKVIKR